MLNDPTRYCVIDTKTGKTVGTYATANRARSERDRLDLRYGAIRYRVVMPSVPARTTANPLAVQVDGALDQPNVAQ